MRGYRWLGVAALLAAGCGGGAAMDEQETVETKADGTSGKLAEGYYKLVGAVPNTDPQPFQMMHIAAGNTFDLYAGAYASALPLAVADGTIKLTKRGSTRKIELTDTSSNVSIFSGETPDVFTYTMLSHGHVKLSSPKLKFEMEPFAPTFDDLMLQEIRVMFNNVENPPSQGVIKVAQLPQALQAVAKTVKDPSAVWFQETVSGKTIYAVNTATDEEDPVVSIDVYDDAGHALTGASSVGPGYPYTWDK